MSVRVLIADDEPKLVQYLCERLTELWPEIEICGTAANGDDALAQINAARPDLAFLDIKMPGLSGLEVAKKIGSLCAVVFVTAYQKYAVDAFEEEAVDYLLKPVNDDRLKRTISRVKNRFAGKEKAQQDLGPLLAKLAQAVVRKEAYVRYLRAASGKVTRLIAVKDVLFIRARAKYTFAVTKDGEFIMRVPLSELIKQLDPEQFWQIHRSIVVNVSKIVSVAKNGREVHVLRVLGHQELLPVSRSFLHLFKQM